MYEVNYLFSLLIPSIFLITFLVASVKKVRVYDSFTEGMKGAIPLIVSIFPYIAAVTHTQRDTSAHLQTTSQQSVLLV